jgi:hypothetical protein
MANIHHGIRIHPLCSGSGSGGRDQQLFMINTKNTSPLSLNANLRPGGNVFVMQKAITSAHRGNS